MARIKLLGIFLFFTLPSFSQTIIAGYGSSGTSGSNNGITSLTGDVSASGPGAAAATVTAINGVSLGSLATGVLKNTTTTGVPFISKVALTEPASSATLTIANLKTLTISNTLTFTGTDSSSVAFGTGGTVLYNGGALGTPSSGDGTNFINIPLSSLTGLGTSVGTFLATPTSANLASAITNETGTGLLVFNNGPTFIAPLLGIPASGVATNLTGLPLSGLLAQSADTVVANATGGSASPTAVAWPTTGTNGCSGVSNAIGYNTTTHSFVCNTISGSATNVFTVDNVIADGAVGDCSTDDTAVIQTALTNSQVVYFPKPTTCYFTTNTLFGKSDQWIIGASRPVSGTNGGIKSNNTIADGLAFTKSGTILAKYVSGGSATGSTGQTCNVTAFNGTVGSGALGKIKLTGSNSIAGGIISMTAYGTGYTGTSTQATLTTDTATCSGNIVITSSLGQGARNVYIQNLNIADGVSGTRTSGNGLVIDGTGDAAIAHVTNTHVFGFENSLDGLGWINSSVDNSRFDLPLNDGLHFHGQTNTEVDVWSTYVDAAARYGYYCSICNYSRFIGTSNDASGSDCMHFETADGGQSRGLTLQPGCESTTAGHGISLDASGVSISAMAITGIPAGKSVIFLNGADTVSIDGGYGTGGDYTVNLNADPGHGGNLNSIRILNPIHGTPTYNDVNNRILGRFYNSSEIAVSDLTGLTAALTTHALYTPANSGRYRVSYTAKITTVASTGAVTSNLGGTTGFVLHYTDSDDSVAQTLTLPATAQTGNTVTIGTGNTTNTTTTISQGSAVVNAKTAVAMTYDFGYASNTAAQMAYSIHVTVEMMQ